MTRIADRHRALAAEFTRRVDGVAPGSWENPSPCAGWAARDVVRHMLDNYRMFPGYVGLTIEPEHSADSDPAAAWAEARDRMQDILQDPARAGLEYDGMMGRTSLESSVDNILCFDLLVHAWDLARATGQDETLPADEVSRVYAAALRMGDMLRMDGVCGPEVAVDADAGEQARLLGLVGRVP